MGSIFKKAADGIDAVFGDEKHSHSHLDEVCDDLHPQSHTMNRFHSFAPPSSGNIKWFVDGCSYFWAVSEALEQARESIYILDWWLSPELYLRRPPSKNEKYRLDAMLKAAAERGVKVNVIIYKEVEEALSLDSAHSKSALEALHPNIRVFRHPDHSPTGYDIEADFGEAFSNLTTFDLAKASEDAIHALYGSSDDVVLFWAHHEKLLIIDRNIGFMGGLDLCFGRWDTNSHPIADAHPANLDKILFPGQDFNNARIYDFSNLNHWDQNQLDRSRSSRMGWSDVSMSMNGPIVETLVAHFVDRWNYIFTDKYKFKNPGKYESIAVEDTSAVGTVTQTAHRYLGGLTEQMSRGMSRLMSEGNDEEKHDDELTTSTMPQIQLTRSCTKWSSGHSTEHSIANAYAHAIRHAEHFIYIENQFFITATSHKQLPVANKIGAAIVERIIRAHNEGQPFKMWVAMPAVPGFAGDLKSDGALGTRAIMEFQYNSISRGGHSIYDKLREAGIEDPTQYIGFYNLRNFDRINDSKTMHDIEQRADVSYGDARQEHDEKVTASSSEVNTEHYEKYQQAASNVEDTTSDTVSSCYMDGGPSIVDLPWDGNPEDEMDAFVSEELYIHTKILIADDRLVICGSANMNDRSQLGTHDSEIAVVIEDPTPVESVLNGEPYTASKFAASLRRQIFRKHLGLLPDQPWDKPNNNWLPVDRAPTNDYDWDSPADHLVRDVMHSNFDNLWKNTARTNTEVFSKAFHAVPDDKVRTWDDYDKFYSQHFFLPKPLKTEKNQEGDKGEENVEQKGKVEYGHIVSEEFPGGVEEAKQWLSRIRGNVVEMPLNFLVDVDNIAKEGLELNSFTDEIYT